MTDITEQLILRHLGQVDYQDTWQAMKRFTDERGPDTTDEIWLLEHPPLYTAGTSAKPADLTDPDRFPVYESKRGGQYTYHGPGQRVAYVMLDVKWEEVTGKATHYHADYVAPYWAPTLEETATVGKHVFYRWGNRKPAKPAPLQDS